MGSYSTAAIRPDWLEMARPFSELFAAYGVPPGRNRLLLAGRMAREFGPTIPMALEAMRIEPQDVLAAEARRVVRQYFGESKA